MWIERTTSRVPGRSVTTEPLHHRWFGSPVVGKYVAAVDSGESTASSVTFGHVRPWGPSDLDWEMSISPWCINSNFCTGEQYLQFMHQGEIHIFPEIAERGRTHRWFTAIHGSNIFAHHGTGLPIQRWCSGSVVTSQDKSLYLPLPLDRAAQLDSAAASSLVQDAIAPSSCTIHNTHSSFELRKFLCVRTCSEAFKNNNTWVL